MIANTAPVEKKQFQPYEACVRHLSTSLEQDALNKLRHDRSDLHLHVPLLSRVFTVELC